MSRSRRRRRWVIRTVIGVWIGSALLILILSRIHPPTLVSVYLVVRQLSFKTNAKEILSQTNERHLVISGISSLEIRSRQALNVTREEHVLTKVNYLKLLGRSLTSCSFDNVTSTGLKLSGPSLITLIWREGKDSFAITSHGSLAGTLTSQPGAGLGCRNVEMDGKPVESLDVEFLGSGGDSLDFTTATDARLNFRDIEASPDDSQIPIIEPLRVSYVEPAASFTEEKTVLLTPPSGEKNRIHFDNTGSEIELDSGDLLVIIPDNNFYLRQFRVDNGIVLSLAGVVKDIKVGAGVKNLRGEMPSVLDHLDAKSRMLAVIPSVVALIFAILEKIKVLPAK